MVTERTVHIRVGIFVTAGLVLAMFAIFMIGSERSWFEKRYTLYCTFDDISGLGPGAPVALAGMRVGSVKAVEFPQEEYRKALMVVLDINQQFQDRIRTDSEASIETQGLLGDKKISITIGNAEAAPLKDGEHLKTASTGDLYSIGKDASDIISDAKKVLRRVDHMLQHAEEGHGALGALLYDEEGRALVHNLNAGAQSFNAFMRRTAEAGDIRRVVANLEESTADLQAITSKMRRGEGSLGALLSDDAIYNDLRALFGRARRNVILRSIARSALRHSETEQ
ncbi:MAG: MCE family protein [Deltaproteobacteria bacterium]|nr:MCE family protein [Deltaproteobacteria bacterium]